MELRAGLLETSWFQLPLQNRTPSVRTDMRKCKSRINLCRLQLFFPSLVLSQIGDGKDGTTWAVIILIALVVLFRLVSYLLSSRAAIKQGSDKGYGYLGGTVCPKCGRPFSIHLWSLRLLVARYDRCPYCKKWSFVNRQSIEVLASAENQFELTDIARVEDKDKENMEPANYRRKLDESKFDEG